MKPKRKTVGKTEAVSKITEAEVAKAKEKENAMNLDGLDLMNIKNLHFVDIPSKAMNLTQGICRTSFIIPLEAARPESTGIC